MSSDFFKVKKGLNIKPTDPSTLGDLQDGDIVLAQGAGHVSTIVQDLLQKQRRE